MRSLNILISNNGYPLSWVLAVSLHVAALATIFYLQSLPSQGIRIMERPTTIKSLFIDENPQLANQRIQDQRRVERERVVREREQQREAEEAARIAALERRLEIERQVLLDRERMLEWERERRREVREEQAEREEMIYEQAAAARSEFELVQSASALIEELVTAQWSRPPSARNGMRTVLRIEMLPTGRVTAVAMVESSGDAAFDRSAETAIRRAAPFSELQQLPIRLFNREFRTLVFTFEPEDMLN